MTASPSKRPSPAAAPSFEALAAAAAKAAPLGPAERDDPGRAARMTHRLGPLHVDHSKHAVGLGDLDLLEGFAREMRLEEARDALFAGEPVNETEGRSVGHHRLRSGNDPEAEDVLRRMERFCGAVEGGGRRGATGRAFTDAVSVGIGGSDLGPRMALTALGGAKREGGVRVHFVSNVDGHHIAPLLARLDPETTLVLVASKTFTTLETTLNARTALAWLSRALPEGAAGRHLAAATANVDAALGLGADREAVFESWDWVGGRFSMWGAAGLPVALGAGFAGFRELLGGAREMDAHFRTARLQDNVPVQGALLQFWHSSLKRAGAWAVLPYDRRLRVLPAYLQQLVMESNGKGTARDGRPAALPTSPVVWGGTGTDGQHAFFQFLHQGTSPVPCDFIAVARPGHSLGDHHRWTVANCLAQSRALLLGKGEREARAEGVPEGLVPFRTFPGGRSSTTVLMESLSPRALGMLAALHEHQVFCLGHLQNIHSFDQWGVELGKDLARDVHARLDGGGGGGGAGLDASTDGLIGAFREFAGGAGGAGGGAGGGS